MVKGDGGGGTCRKKGSVISITKRKRVPGKKEEEVGRKKKIEWDGVVRVEASDVVSCTMYKRALQLLEPGEDTAKGGEKGHSIPSAPPPLSIVLPHKCLPLLLPRTLTLAY